MNYSYYIDRGRIFEIKIDVFDFYRISVDMWGESIEFLVENQSDYKSLHQMSQRKIDWLKKEHPELMI